MWSFVSHVAISAGVGVVGCMCMCISLEGELFSKQYVMEQPMFEVIGEYNQCDIIRFTSGSSIQHFLDCPRHITNSAE